MVGINGLLRRVEIGYICGDEDNELLTLVAPVKAVKVSEEEGDDEREAENGQ